MSPVEDDTSMTTSTSQVQIVSPDNGYFETVRFACGCERSLHSSQMYGLSQSRQAAVSQAARERAAKNHRCDEQTRPLES